MGKIKPDEAIIFGSVSERADYASKLTIMRKGKEIRTIIWSAGKEKLDVKNYKYIWEKSARTFFRAGIGNAIKGGWKVLNVFPQTEWEE
jgi:hypothetical protein